MCGQSYFAAAHCQYNTASPDTVRHPHDPHTHRQVEAHQVQDGVLEHGAVARAQHEAIPVGPLGVLGVDIHEVLPDDVGHGGAAHGQPRVARLGLKWKRGSKDSEDGMQNEKGKA